MTNNQMINWNEIDTVLLDMDGTILDLSFDNFFWKVYLPEFYAEKNDISLKQSQQFLSDSYSKFQGKLEWYCLDFWSERLNINIAELKKNQKQRICFRPYAEEFLKFLSQTNKKIYLATNAHPKSIEVKLLAIQFEDYFDDLNSSHEFGYPKEEQGYWVALQKKYQFDRKKTLFIDDNVQVLESAKRFGIGYLFGIQQPDLTQPNIDCSPFESIESFKSLIEY